MRPTQKKATLTKFFPKEGSSCRQLLTSDYGLRSLYVHQCLYFEGSIKLPKFKQALQETLDQFSFYFGRLETSDKNTYISYSGEESVREKYAVHLETVEETITFEDAADREESDYLPTQVQDERMIAYWPQMDFENCPMLAMKLTVFHNGFIIGSVFNHVINDQSSYIYFLKSLSRRYSDKANLLAPTIFEKSKLLVEKKEQDQHKDEQISLCSPGGRYIYIDNLLGKLTLVYYGIKNFLRTRSQQMVVGLHFEKNAINRIKKNAPGISTNDIMHAFALKYMAGITEDYNKFVRVIFIQNMRNHAGLGEEAIGNIFTLNRHREQVKKVREMSIEDLALQNRKILCNNPLDDYKSDLAWLQQITQKYGYEATQFCASNEFINHNEPMFMITSWRNFNYEEINFDGNLPFALRPTFNRMLSPNTGFISFYHRGNKSTIVLNMTIWRSHKKKLDTINSEHSGLFTIKNIYPREFQTQPTIFSWMFNRHAQEEAGDCKSKSTNLAYSAYNTVRNNPITSTLVSVGFFTASAVVLKQFGVGTQIVNYFQR